MTSYALCVFRVQYVRTAQIDRPVVECAWGTSVHQRAGPMEAAAHDCLLTKAEFPEVVYQAAAQGQAGSTRANSRKTAGCGER